MKKPLAVLMLLTLSVSALAQTGTTLNVQTTANIFTEMGGAKAGRLALAKQSGPFCQASLGPLGGNYIHALRVRVGTTWVKYLYGKKTTYQNEAVLLEQNTNSASIQQQNQLHKFLALLKNNILIPEAHAAVQTNLAAYISALPATLPVYVIPTFSAAEVKASLTAMGNKVIASINAGNCGTVSFENYTQNFNQLQTTTEFYSKNGKVFCKAQGLVQKYRDPLTCLEVSAASAMPEEPCKLLYRTMSAKSGRNDGTGLPLIKVLPNDLALEFAISEVLIANPAIAATTFITDTAHLEHVVPNFIEMMEAAPVTAVNFASQPLATKQFFASAALTHEATKNNSQLIKFSPTVQALLGTLSSSIDTFLINTPTYHPALIATPTVAAMQDEVKAVLAPFHAVTGIHHLFNKGCSYEMLSTKVAMVQDTQKIQSFNEVSSGTIDSSTESNNTQPK